mmetsp:Transcript_50065/g.107277  ORF Transcript_50065/g.107277 Transcript_50065/m.107277 type:complete len:513 (+) Transcript_50065:97-1635(+)
MDGEEKKWIMGRWEASQVEWAAALAERQELLEESMAQRRAMETDWAALLQAECQTARRVQDDLRSELAEARGEVYKPAPAGGAPPAMPRAPSVADLQRVLHGETLAPQISQLEQELTQMRNAAGPLATWATSVGAQWLEDMKGTDEEKKRVRGNEQKRFARDAAAVDQKLGMITSAVTHLHSDLQAVVGTLRSEAEVAGAFRRRMTYFEAEVERRGGEWSKAQRELEQTKTAKELVSSRVERLHAEVKAEQDNAKQLRVELVKAEQEARGSLQRKEWELKEVQGLLHKLKEQATEVDGVNGWLRNTVNETERRERILRARWEASDKEWMRLLKKDVREDLSLATRDIHAALVLERDRARELAEELRKSELKAQQEKKRAEIDRDQALRERDSTQQQNAQLVDQLEIASVGKETSQSQLNKERELQLRATYQREIAQLQEQLHNKEEDIKALRTAHMRQGNFIDGQTIIAARMAFSFAIEMARDVKDESPEFSRRVRSFIDAINRISGGVPPR